MASQTVCEAMYVVFHSNFAAYIVSQRCDPCEFPGFVWTDCWGNKSCYVITSPANSHLKIPIIMNESNHIWIVNLTLGWCRQRKVKAFYHWTICRTQTRGRVLCMHLLWEGYRHHLIPSWRRCGYWRCGRKGNYAQFIRERKLHVFLLWETENF